MRSSDALHCVVTALLSLVRFLPSRLFGRLQVARWASATIMNTDFYRHQSDILSRMTEGRYRASLGKLRNVPANPPRTTD